MAYTKNTWATGDIITADKLNNLESGLDTTVTKVNNLAIGGRNLLLGTANAVTGVGNNSFDDNFNAQGGEYYLAGGKRLSDIYNQYGSSGHLTISFDWVASGSTISGTFNSQWNNTPWGTLSNGSISPSNSNLSGHYEYTVSLGTNGFSTSAADAVAFRQDNLQGNITISNLKLESGNKATDWTPAPEDVPSNDLQLVHKTGTETVAGDKTFTGGTNFTGQTTLQTGNYGLRVTTGGVQKTSDGGTTWVNI